MKKLISILLVVALFLCGACITANAEVTTSTNFGDPKKDGKIDAADALLVLQYAVNKVEMPYSKMCYYDLNTDLQVNASDALLILKMAVNKLSVFPAEDSYTGTIVNLTADNVLKTNHIALQNGGTGIMALRFDNVEGSYRIRYEYSAQYANLLKAEWNSAGWLDEGETTITINFMAIGAVTKTTTVPVKVFFEDHPSIYQMVYVDIVPDTATVPGYFFCGPVKDFGVYVNTAPSSVTTAIESGKEVIRLRYSSRDALANGATANSYDEYIQAMSTNLGEPTVTTSSYGTKNFAFTGTNYTLNAYLMTENDNQYVALDFIIG